MKKTLLSASSALALTLALSTAAFAQSTTSTSSTATPQTGVPQNYLCGTVPLTLTYNTDGSVTVVQGGQTYNLTARAGSTGVFENTSGVVFTLTNGVGSLVSSGTSLADNCNLQASTAPAGSSTTTAPATGTTTPPADSSGTTPPATGTTPPADATTTPPASGSTTPPADSSGTTPPATGTTPPATGTTPPADATTTPPATGTTPPADASTPATPTTTTPPVTAQTTPAQTPTLSEASTPIDASALEGNWRIYYVSENGQLTKTPEANRPTVTVTGGQLSLNTGCNTATGSLSVSGDQLTPGTLSTTPATTACTDASVQAVDTNVLGAFGGASTATLRDYGGGLKTLVLRGPNNSVVILVASPRYSNTSGQ